MAIVKLGGLNKAITKIFIDSKNVTTASANRALRGAIIQNWGDIMVGTPVVDGGARGGWFVTQGAPSKVNDGRKDKTKGSPYVLANTNNNMFGEKWFLTNNVPYIVKLEFGGYGTKKRLKVTPQGFSLQAPAGMVRINLARFPAQLAKIFKATV